MILAFETATEVCSVSFKDANGEVHEKRMQGKGSHSEALFLFVRELMEEYKFKISELDSVLVSNGPGSYTGLRIAASAVKGMLFGMNVDVYAVNTLAGFAASLMKESEGNSIHAVINARRKHLYHQEFKTKKHTLIAQSNAAVLELDQVNEKISSGQLIVGTGIDRLDESRLEVAKTFGLEKVSAAALITLFDSESRIDFFTRTTAEELESNYISSGQVNNTAV